MLITVWRDKFADGWTGPTDSIVVHPTRDVREALADEYDSDAHFVPYHIRIDGELVEAIPRINMRGLGELRKKGADVLFSVLALDVDDPSVHGTPVDASAEWRAEQKRRLDELVAPLDRWGYYETRGGFRVVFALDEPSSVESYKVLHALARTRLAAAGIHADPNCSDWTRCYRLPNVLRDGKKQRRAVDLDRLEASRLSELRAEEREPAPRPFEGVESVRPPFTLPDTVDENRHLTLTRFAGVLRSSGADEEEISIALRSLVESGRLGDWTDKHDEEEIERRIASIAQSVARYEIRSSDAVQADEPSSEPPPTFTIGSQAEFAGHICRQLGGEDRLVYDRGRVFRYSEPIGVWEHLDESIVYNATTELDGESIFGGLDKNGQPRIRQIRVSANLQEGVYKVLARGLTRPGFFDRAVEGLSFENGFVRVAGGGVEIEPFSPDQRSTSRLEWSFERGKKPALFLRSLRQMFAGDEDAETKIGVLREFVGACLLGRPTIYQKGLILEGDGANGKSTILDVVVALFGDQMVTAIPPHDLGQEYRRAMLSESRINVVNELPESDILETHGVKACITGDAITARHIRENPFMFKPRAGHLIAANELPSVRDLSRGFWRKWIVLSFRREFAESEQDRTLSERIIRTELDAIASWAIEGAANLERRGRYDVPESSEQAINQWRLGADSVARFLDEMTEESSDEGTKASDLFSRYQRFCNATGSRPVSATKFGRRVRRLGVKKIKRAAGFFYDVEISGGISVVRPEKNFFSTSTKKIDEVPF